MSMSGPHVVARPCQFGFVRSPIATTLTPVLRSWPLPTFGSTPWTVFWTSSKSSWLGSVQAILIGSIRFQT